MGKSERRIALKNEKLIVEYILKKIDDPNFSRLKLVVEMKTFLKAAEVLPSYAFDDFVKAFFTEDSHPVEEPADA